MEGITHYKPVRKKSEDRRKVNTFVANDRRSGVGCRRRVAEIEMEIRSAKRIVTFYPPWKLINI